MHAKFSKRFYDRFGEEIVNELVDLLNQVDATHKSDLRELNEVNFARFDARLEQRLAELRAELRVELHEGLMSLGARIDGLAAAQFAAIVGLYAR